MKTDIHQTLQQAMSALPGGEEATTVSLDLLGGLVKALDGQTVLVLTPAHVIALRRYLALDMDSIGVSDNKAQWTLLHHILSMLGGAIQTPGGDPDWLAKRNHQVAENNRIMTEHCMGDPELMQIQQERFGS